MKKEKSLIKLFLLLTIIFSILIGYVSTQNKGDVAIKKPLPNCNKTVEIKKIGTITLNSEVNKIKEISLDYINKLDNSFIKNYDFSNKGLFIFSEKKNLKI